MATQSSGFGAGRNNAERKAVPGSDTGGNSGDTAARPNVVSNINSNLMVQDKATKRWIPLQFDSSGATGFTITLSSGAFRDAEGTPANVAAAAATGTSIFSARRDHVHTIGAGVVTNAMLAGSIDLTSKVTGQLPLANGGSAANLTASNGGIVYSTASAFAILSGTATASKVLVSQSSTAPVWSTPTLPVTSSPSAGKVMIGDGTNWVSSTPTYPNAAPGAGTFLRGDGTNFVTSTTTIPNSFVGGAMMVTTSTTAMTESSGYRSVPHASSPYTVVASDCEAVIGADASGGTVAINLPALASTNTGFRITIINIGSSGAPTVVPNGTDKIDGTNVTHTLNAQYSKMVLRSAGNTSPGWLVESAEDYLSSTFSSVTADTSAAWHSPTGGSITLTPGEWDISGQLVTTANANNITTIQTNVNNSVGAGTAGDNQVANSQTIASGVSFTLNVNPYKKTEASATETWTLNYNITWATTAPTIYGRISARRVR